MQFDVFFSLSHTPVDGEVPSEAQMFQNFFDQVQAADELGYETAWLAEAHLSSEVQKKNKKPTHNYVPLLNSDETLASPTFLPLV